MKDIAEHRDPIPEEFGSEEEAGDFWDTHSLADYEEFLEPADVDIDIRQRRFEIEVDENVFHVLTERAEQTQTSVKELASLILKEKLVTA